MARSARFVPFVDDFVLAIAVVVAVILLAPRLILWTLLGIALYLALKLWILRAQFWQPATGVEGMRGRFATALTDLTPRGQVDFDGAVWGAQANVATRAGERVRVDAVDGLTLIVSPAGLMSSLHEPRRNSVLLGLAARLRWP